MQLNKIALAIGALALSATMAVAKPLLITVDISSQAMWIEHPSGDVSKWKVSTGRSGFRTPTGTYKPQRLSEHHRSKKYHNAPMPYAIFFSGGYAIHATGAVGKIGTPASHGCVRLPIKNAQQLYRWVQAAGPKNTKIKIIN